MTDKGKVPTWKVPPRTVKQLLKRARKILAKPERWTKGTYARDRYGEPVSLFYSVAESFCLLGALERADTDNGTMYLAGRDFLNAFLGGNAHTFNDRRTTEHRDILGLLDGAIEKARQ